MATVAGVGKSSNRRSKDAGREATEAAMKELPGGKADVVLVFATAAHNQEALLGAIGEASGQAPMSGCSGAGVITQGAADEGIYSVAVMAIASDKARFTPVSARDYSKDAVESGKRIADGLREHAKGRALLLFPDGLTGSCGTLLESVQAALPYPIAVAGGLAADSMKLVATNQYFNGQVSRDSVSGLLISGDVDAEIGVSHGCEPVGLERTVTKSDGGFVCEIDGMPAWTVFKEYLDGDPEDLTAADVTHLCIGRQLPGAHTEGYDKYVIRTPLALDKARGALFFPGGLEVGTRIQMTRRDADRISRTVKESAQQVRARHPDRDPALVLHFDCAGRGQNIFGTKTYEVAVSPAQEAFRRSTPWAGFHAFGEIAPLGDVPYYHNYSAVLFALFDK